MHKGPTCAGLMLSVVLHLQCFPRPFESLANPLTKVCRRNASWIKMYSFLGVQLQSKPQCTSTGHFNDSALTLQRVCFNLWGGNADLAIVMSQSELLCPDNKTQFNPLLKFKSVYHSNLDLQNLLMDSTMYSRSRVSLSKSKTAA